MLDGFGTSVVKLKTACTAILCSLVQAPKWIVDGWLQHMCDGMNTCEDNQARLDSKVKIQRRQAQSMGEKPENKAVEYHIQHGEYR